MPDSNRVNRKAIVSALAPLVLPLLIVLDSVFPPSDPGANIGFGMLVLLAFVGGIAVGVLAFLEIRRTGERGKLLALFGVLFPSAYMAYFLVLAPLL